MASTFYELDCGEDEPVVMERRDDGELIFHGWDQDAEAAAVELGFEPSLCFVVHQATRSDDLDWALWHSIRDHNAPLVAALLAGGADPNAEDPNYKKYKGTHNPAGTPLGTAILEGDPDVVLIVIEAGADVNADDGYALTKSARLGDHALVDILLSAGADAHADDYEALRQADQYGHTTVVKILKDWIGEHGAWIGEHR
jgi:hypothetical protein